MRFRIRTKRTRPQARSTRQVRFQISEFQRSAIGGQCEVKIQNADGGAGVNDKNGATFTQGFPELVEQL